MRQKLLARVEPTIGRDDAREGAVLWKPLAVRRKRSVGVFGGGAPRAVEDLGFPARLGAADRRTAREARAHLDIAPPFRLVVPRRPHRAPRLGKRGVLRTRPSKHDVVPRSRKQSRMTGIESHAPHVVAHRMDTEKLHFHLRTHPALLGRADHAGQRNSQHSDEKPCIHLDPPCFDSMRKRNGIRPHSLPSQSKSALHVNMQTSSLQICHLKILSCGNYTKTTLTSEMELGARQSRFT